MEHPRCSKDLGQRVSRSSYGNCGDSEEIQLLGPWWGLAVPQPTIAMSRTPVSFGWHVARDVTVLRSRIDEAIYQFGLPEDAEMNRILRPIRRSTPADSRHQPAGAPAASPQRGTRASAGERSALKRSVKLAVFIRALRQRAYSISSDAILDV